ncbi:Inactive beta-amylase 9 [Apostasia shenzhenica]|uniref:Beta-amylase n=1 Tax=Apostasia shenzhenica TaxID=1088818 RepID=A0A2I0B3A8_9ASPA|nr:Inactive beta-amylase 9 [Apostasia shenzhenica]
MEFATAFRHAGVAAPELIPARSWAAIGGGSCGRRAGRSLIVLNPTRDAWVRRAVPAVRSVIAAEKLTPSASKGAGTGPVQLFVGLPLDAVSNCNTINHARAIAIGLRALKLLGVDGVELPVWWGIVQPDLSTSGAGNWSSYLALAGLVLEAGLRLRVSLNLHSSETPAIPLPRWISRIIEANPDILCAGRSGLRCRDCLSFAVDELPVLDGRTPIKVYEDFFLSFRSAFSELFGNTVTDISVGLGPNGELRYPSSQQLAGRRRPDAIGEFQCYDKYMLADLKKHAEESGNPLWGLGGPHDAPEYNQAPDSSGFFRENGGSWQTPYGDFFLSWYSEQLLLHGDRLLSVASKVFDDLPVRLSAKVPLLHYWHRSRSRPAELISGFYNTEGRDGYEAIANMFSRNSVTMIVPGLDLADGDERQELLSSPELLLSQIMTACKRHRVRVSGENSLLSRDGFYRIKKHLLSENSQVESYTHQRMGAHFFSPEHFPLFTEFVRSFALPELDADDMVSDEERKMTLPNHAASGNDREMQAV